MGLSPQDTELPTAGAVGCTQDTPQAHLGWMPVSGAPCKIGDPQGKGLHLHMASAKCHCLCRPTKATLQPASPVFSLGSVVCVQAWSRSHPTNTKWRGWTRARTGRVFRTDSPFCPLRDNQEPRWHPSPPGRRFPQWLRRKMLRDMEERQ